MAPRLTSMIRRTRSRCTELVRKGTPTIRRMSSSATSTEVAKVEARRRQANRTTADGWSWMEPSANSGEVAQAIARRTFSESSSKARKAISHARS
eukprot:scaffold36314_cov31-Tisochrysis_lutea.AAC.8